MIRFLNLFKYDLSKNKRKEKNALIYKGKEIKENKYILPINKNGDYRNRSPSIFEPVELGLCEQNKIIIIQTKNDSK